MTQYPHLTRTDVIKNHGLFMMGLSVFLFIFFKNAWVADDAYIAFRSVEQLFAGNGPRWNIDERVQVFTSPLWFFLLSFSYLFFDSLFVASIALSMACCLGLLIIARKLIKNDLNWLVFVFFITGIWGVMDFSSSGLENPLLYFLLTYYLWGMVSFIKAREDILRQAYFSHLFFALGLLSITRHDVSTLVFIPTLYSIWVAWHVFGFGFVVRKSWLVLVPFAAWTTFSVIYYGMPFPNTAYAKIMHGVPRVDLIDFGKLYLYVSLRWEYVAQLLLVSAVWFIFSQRNPIVVVVVSGVLLNLCYVVYVGGDFMQGRFVSVPLFLLALVVCAISLNTKAVASFLIATIIGITVIAYVPMKLSPSSGFDIGEGKRHFSWNGILNERNFYFKTNSLWAYLHRDSQIPFPDHKWCRMGTEAKEKNKRAVGFGGIGMYGYCAGLEMTVVDRLGLGDPYLARLPLPEGRPWRAGHFNRKYPNGFYESRISGENRIEQPQLAAFWDDVQLLVRAPLFADGRWAAIWRVNTGYYHDIGKHYAVDIAQ